MDPRSHWDAVYLATPPSEVSWFQPTATRSLALIRRVASNLDTPIIDVGGGASTLVDDLLKASYDDVTVLDLSGVALATAQARLGPSAGRRVQWIEADVRTAPLPRAKYGVWHDRAVFHFLTEAADREAYVAQVRRAVRPGGYVLVSTFALNGPQRCSGLEVSRYSPAGLHAEFGAGFRLVAAEEEEHHTPSGVLQAFIYCLCRYDPPLSGAGQPHR